MKVSLVEHGQMCLIGIPSVNMNDIGAKYRHNREGVLSAAPYLPGVKGHFIHYGVSFVEWQHPQDRHTYITCIEVESFEGVPEWFSRIVLPAQRCVVAVDANVDEPQRNFDAANEAIGAFIRSNGLIEDAAGRRYTISERYDARKQRHGGFFDRYSLPVRSA